MACKTRSDCPNGLECVSGECSHPPNGTVGINLAPPPPRALQAVQLERIGIKGTLEVEKKISEISGFDWRNSDDIKRYLFDTKWYLANEPPHRFKNLGPGKTYITPISNQGKCGNCWAQACSSMISDRYCIHNDLDNTDGSYTFSANQLTECATSPNNGCDGGIIYSAFEHIRDNGIYFAKDCTSLKCSSNLPAGCNEWGELPASKLERPIPQTVSVKNERGDILNFPAISNYYEYYNDLDELVPAVENPTDDQRIRVQQHMKFGIVVHGPLVCAIYVDSKVFNPYKGGVIKVDHKYGQPANHAVKIIGWGTDATDGEYWIIANSWGTKWGEEGYFRLAMSRESVNPDIQADYPIQIMEEKTGLATYWGGATGCLVLGQNRSPTIGVRGVSLVSFEDKKGKEIFLFVFVIIVIVLFISFTR